MTVDDDMLNKLREEAKGTPEERLTRLEAWRIQVMNALEQLLPKPKTE